MGALELAGLAAAALVAGFVDAIAGGGGLITVPALLWAGLPPAMALGTNKLQSSCGTALATWTYARAGLLAVPGLKSGMAATLCGAAVGAWGAGVASPDRLRQIVAVLLAVVVVFFWFRPDLGRERRPARISAVPFALLFGAVLGAYDGFFGPGTGAFWMTACVAVGGFDLRGATGYTKAMNLTSNAAALAVFLVAGQVHWEAGCVMAAAQLVGASLGARMAVKRGAAIIRPMFLTVVALLTLKLVWDALSRR
jgi:uncharacterized protein